DSGGRRSGGTAGRKGADGIDRRSGRPSRVERDRRRGHEVSERRAAHRDHPEGVPRDDVPGDCGHAGMPAEYGQDPPLSRAVVIASSSRATRAVGARNGEARMNDTFQCGDPGALVAYLYDECEPGERDLIAAHVTRCVTCASEIDTLSATRRTLAAWRPPDVELGFQITRSQDAAPAKVLTPNIAWWRA